MKRAGLTLGVLALAQLLTWLLVARGLVLARAVEHDIDISEKLVRSDDFRPEHYSDSFEYVIICEETSAQLSAEQISKADARMRLLMEGVGIVPSTYVTYADWVSQFREESILRATASGTRPNVGGVCATSRVNNPIFAKVTCDDRTFSETYQHGHTHFFLHLFGTWVPVWTGDYWVS